MPNVALLSVPGLRRSDLSQMPRLSRLISAGDQATLVPSFPCVTWPVQASMLTGVSPQQHGVIANGFFWREQDKVEMWTAGNEVITAPQIWDKLRQRDLQSAAWFPMLSKRSAADFVCMPAPVHNPDGSESLWCYTKPTDFYGELLAALGHFPLQHFWGPLANIRSTDWIVDSAVIAAQRWRPRFFYLYLPHLDYAAQKLGPDSDAAMAAVAALDETIGRLAEGVGKAYGDDSMVWMVASEYVITPVDHVTYPNRDLREAGLLSVHDQDDGEHLDRVKSAAWALVDHQFSHVYVRDRDATTVERVAAMFQGRDGIDEVLVGKQRAAYRMEHQRSGDVILISTPNSWQAYYWWLDDARAPAFARTVDIHKKPGYDPVELHFDPESKQTPLDARLVRGSHGAPARDASQQGIFATSYPGIVGSDVLRDQDICQIVVDRFGD